MIRFIKHDYFLIIASLLLIILAILYPHKIANYPRYVDWQTIIILAGLFLITTGLKESFFFSSLSQKILNSIRYERNLALVVVIITAVFSSFLTNDITILIMVPLILSLKERINNDINKIVILEIIAANTGSLLTPIGNPQNIYIWHRYNLSFFPFIKTMLPLEATLIFILLIVTALTVRKKPLSLKATKTEETIKKSLLLTSGISLISFIVLIELKLSLYAFIILIIIYLIFFRKIITKIDWSILLLFIILFIDIHLVGDIKWVKGTIVSLNMKKASSLFLTGIVSSQILSNVPSTFLLSQHTYNWRVLAYSVNIGGNGSIISSLANVIALKIDNSPYLKIRFHLYSFGFLAISGIAGYILLLI